MKRIFFITSSLSSGGAERVMAVLANRLSEIGYNTTIISKAHIPPFYEIKNRVKLVFLPPKINYNNKVSTFFGRCILNRNIYKYLKNEKPDIVISFSTTTNGSMILICRLLKLFVIASEHNNYKVNLKSLPIWLIKRHIYPHATYLTVLTERDKIEYYGKYMKNVIVMPNPLPLQPIDKINLRHRKELILAVGNLSRWRHKGFDKLLVIFSKIEKKYSNWQLFIAGAGDPTWLKKEIKNLNLENRVILLGAVKDIQSLMLRSSIFAMTSRWEGLPMVLIEAMSQGMACIAFDCFTGPGDIIKNGSDGILIEDQNIDLFVNKLSALIEKKELRLKLGLNAVETSRKYFPEKILQKWFSLFEKIGLDE